MRNRSKQSSGTPSLGKKANLHGKYADQDKDDSLTWLAVIQLLCLVAGWLLLT